MTTADQATVDANARGAGRLNCKRLRCEYGEVLNISATGLLIYRRGSKVLWPNQKTHLTLEYTLGQVTVNCRVAWVKRVGFRRRLIGVEFVDVDAETQAALAKAAAGSRYSGHG